MKKIIAFFICWKLITEKGINGIQVYLLPALLIYMFVSTIIGDLLFVAVRLMHLRITYVQKNILPVCILFLFAIPMLIIFNYARDIDIEKLRLQVNSLDYNETKKLRNNGIVSISIIALFPIISLSLLSLLTYFNVI